MLCDICNSRVATIKFTQLINLKKKVVNICEICAEEKGFTNPLIGLQKLFGSMLVLGKLEEIDNKKAEQQELNNIRCCGCNTTWGEFQKNGLLGCEDCYSVFEDQLKLLLRRIHGSNKHIGNRPSSKRIIIQETDLDKLQQNLKIAIKNENYEKAAQLRDRIKDIEANLNRR